MLFSNSMAQVVRLALMIVYTDKKTFTSRILGADLDWESPAADVTDLGLADLVDRLYPGIRLHSARTDGPGPWQFLLMVETAAVSHYDVVVDLCRQNVDLPDGILCLAGAGQKFHGQRNRSWAAPPGNIYLTAFMKPGRITADIGVGFTLLSAVSVIDTIDKIEGLQRRASIKWVNDIYIDGGKAAGFLAHTVSMDGLLTGAVIGIGLNVETAPKIKSDEFISGATSLRRYSPDPEACNQRIAFKHLITSLADNYRRLISGEMSHLLDRYRERSLIISREVEIVLDSPSGRTGEKIRGTVTHIGKNLELYIEGRARPVTRGRLILKT